MKKAQSNAIVKFSVGKTVKVIDITPEESVIVYAQSERGDHIMEYSISPTGTMTFEAAYTATPSQQKFFNESLDLEAFQKLYPNGY
jgi:hypothetical protein